MDVILIILGSICLLTSIVGCVLPMLPGPPIAYAAILLLHFTDKVQFTFSQLVVWLLIVILVQVIDYFVPMFGTQKFGGSKWGIWGCLIGTIAGIFIFPPWGILLGPFIGAVGGELLTGKEASLAIRAGLGAFLGFMLGTIMKFTVCGWFIYIFIKHLII